MSDVVAELDAWLDNADLSRQSRESAAVQGLRELRTSASLVIRARDEIVALREEIEHYRGLYRQGVELLEEAETLMQKARAEALEEAAMICRALMEGAEDDASRRSLMAACAAIRTLKDRENG